MTDTWPEPYATIARLRIERMSDRKIADALGISSDTLASHIRKWQRDHPKRPLPLSDTALRAREREEILSLLKRGIHYRRVAEITGYRKARVSSVYVRARQLGLVEPLRKPPANAYEAWQRQRGNKTAPASGGFAGVLQRMTVAQYEALLRRQTRGDETLAEIIAGVLVEALDGPR